MSSYSPRYSSAYCSSSCLVSISCVSSTCFGFKCVSTMGFFECTQFSLRRSISFPLKKYILFWVQSKYQKKLTEIVLHWFLMIVEITGCEKLIEVFFKQLPSHLKEVRLTVLRLLSHPHNPGAMLKSVLYCKNERISRKKFFIWVAVVYSCNRNKTVMN